MRTLNKLILAAASLALVLGVAGQASATSSISLKLLQGSDGDGNCGPDCIGSLEASDVLRFGIIMTIDSLGMTASGFDLLWDSDLEDELDLTAYRLHNFNNTVTLAAGPGPPPVFTLYAASGPIASQESALLQEGQLQVISTLIANLTSPFAVNTSFRVAFVRFHVTDKVNLDGTQLDLGFFFDSTLTGFAVGDTSLAVPDFGSFQVNSVPEPGTSFLMGMGVLGLIVAGRASRKR